MEVSKSELGHGKIFSCPTSKLTDGFIDTLWMKSLIRYVRCGKYFWSPASKGCAGFIDSCHFIHFEWTVNNRRFNLFTPITFALKLKLKRKTIKFYPLSSCCKCVNEFMVKSVVICSAGEAHQTHWDLWARRLALNLFKLHTINKMKNIYLIFRCASISCFQVVSEYY